MATTLHGESFTLQNCHDPHLILDCGSAVFLAESLCTVICSRQLALFCTWFHKVKCGMFSFWGLKASPCGIHVLYGDLGIGKLQLNKFLIIPAVNFLQYLVIKTLKTWNAGSGSVLKPMRIRNTGSIFQYFFIKFTIVLEYEATKTVT